MDPRATPHPALPQSRTLIREWRTAASDHAIASLLTNLGCRGLTVNAITTALGVAKGSAYLRWPDVESLISAVLDRWVDDVRCAPDDDGDSVAGALCHALFAPVVDGDGVRPAIPCCLHESPCPQGWNDRWDVLAARSGLGNEVIAQVVGEAIQAIASSSIVRELLAMGRFEEAAAVVALVLDPPSDDHED